MGGGPPRILVVDDEPAITDFVSFNLRKEGYAVDVAPDGARALAMADGVVYDLVVLDIMLPGLDGYEVCRRIRAAGDVPVLFLSARDTELDKVVGLELGGDDYLAKPFGIRELLARVRALLRRAAPAPGAALGNSGAGAPGLAIQASGIELDEEAHTALWGSRSLDLTPREFELLACLMRHAGKVLSREQLLRQAWGWEHLVETKTVDTHVRRLRNKLEEVGADPGIVETVRGYGYRVGA